MWRNLFILYFVFVKKQRTIERKKKWSKISALESCYANRIYGTFGVEMRAYGQKLVKFCTQTHRRVNLSSKDILSQRPDLTLVSVERTIYRPVFFCYPSRLLHCTSLRFSYHYHRRIFNYQILCFCCSRSLTSASAS